MSPVFVSSSSRFSVVQSFFLWHFFFPEASVHPPPYLAAWQPDSPGAGSVNPARPASHHQTTKKKEQLDRAEAVSDCEEEEESMPPVTCLTPCSRCKELRCSDWINGISVDKQRETSEVLRTDVSSDSGNILSSQNQESGARQSNLIEVNLQISCISRSHE